MEERWQDFMRQAFQNWRQTVSITQGHPDEETMAGFLAGSLNPAEIKVLKLHFAACPACNLLITLALKAGSAEGTLEPPQELVEKAKECFVPEPEYGPLEVAVKLKDYLVELISTTGDVLMGQELIPAPVLRSRQIKDFKDQLVILKDFKDLRVELKLVTKKERTLSLYVSIKEKPSLAPAEGLRISLVKDEVELESYTSDSGKASFEQVAPDQYRLKILRADQALATVQLDIK